MALSRKPQEIVEDSKNPLLAKHESWGRVLVGNIADILNGFAFKSSKFTNDKGMPLIRIRDVGKDSSETYYDGEFDETYLVNDGDLLVGMDGDFRAAIWKGVKALLNQRVCKIQDPAKLERLIKMIDKEQWSTLPADVKGDIYEGLLEAAPAIPGSRDTRTSMFIAHAQDVKGGAGNTLPRAR